VSKKCIKDKKRPLFHTFWPKNSYNQQIFCTFAGQMLLKVQDSRLMDLSLPRVMAIINVSPDSFYTSVYENVEATRRLGDEVVLLDAVQRALDEGADILDIGACSTRPGSTPVDAAVEWERLEWALKLVRSHFPDAVVSVDTFRADVAEKAIGLGANIINDVSGGAADERMWDVVARYDVPYILTLAQELRKGGEKEGYDYTMSEVLRFFEERLDRLHRMGVKDVVLDPGFGFGKTLEDNYTILREMEVLKVLHAPVLVGVSRKSMLYKPLGLEPKDVLSATIAAQVMALERGANILRVHDVAAAKQAIQIVQLTHKN
jgi:dihydropteroate synthase